MFDVIALDLPGFGEAGEAKTPDTIAGFSEFIVTILSQLSVDRFYLVGHSMGGAIAQQVAIDYPDKIHKLVLYGTSSSGILPERFENFDESIRRLELHGVNTHADRVVPTWFVHGTESPSYSMCRSAVGGLQVNNAIAAQQAIAKWDVTDRIREIVAPTLVVGGDQDRSCSPREAYKLWDNIPNSSLFIVPGCAHTVHLEKPELFAEIVRQFLLGSPEP